MKCLSKIAILICLTRNLIKMKNNISKFNEITFILIFK